ncbi:MAG: hypothetical protein ACLQVI_28675 [Polyangiaceae bacterium]
MTIVRRRLRSVALVTAASLLFSLQASPANAANPKKPAAQTPDEARADAEKRLEEGLQRYAKGDYEGARLAFAQAYAVLTSIDLLYNLMRSEVKSGHPLEALVHIHQMLRDPKATTEDRAKAERLLEEANSVTGHVAIEAPDGAEIVLDDVPSGEAPIKEAFDVTPGKHKVAARANGSSRVTTVDAPAGQIVTARFALEAGRAPTVSGPVPVAGPPAPPPPPPQPQQEPPPPPEPPFDRHVGPPIAVPLVIGALGVISLGIGIGMGLESQNQQSSAASFRSAYPTGFCANQSSSTCVAYQQTLNSQQQDTNISRVMLVTGGVLAVAAVVTYVAWPRVKKKEGSAWVAPSLGGVVVGGEF